MSYYLHTNLVLNDKPIHELILARLANLAIIQNTCSDLNLTIILCVDKPMKTRRKVKEHLKFLRQYFNLFCLIFYILSTAFTHLKKYKMKHYRNT